VKEGNAILEKSFQFGLRIIKLNNYLKERNVDRILCSQVLRSGTSIGANAEEAMGGSSKKDFVQKLRIAYREARETKYWLRLLQASNYIEQGLAVSLLEDCEELIRILVAILNTVGTNS
jgi:four helix bundle protein